MEDKPINTRVNLSFSRTTGGDFDYDDESFNLSFTLRDDSMGELLERVETMMVAMGFVLGNGHLELVDEGRPATGNVTTIR